LGGAGRPGCGDDGAGEYFRIIVSPRRLGWRKWRNFNGGDISQIAAAAQNGVKLLAIVQSRHEFVRIIEDIVIRNDHSIGRGNKSWAAAPIIYADTPLTWPVRLPTSRSERRSPS